MAVPPSRAGMTAVPCQCLFLSPFQSLRQTRPERTNRCPIPDFPSTVRPVR